MYKISGVGIILFLIGFLPLCAQLETSTDPATIQRSTDTAEDSRLFSGRPGKAALYSLVLPGAGQIYNKKYWKLPLVYGAIGGTIFLISDNTSQLNSLTELLKMELVDENATLFTAAQLQRRREQARKNQQTAIVFLAIAWTLNSVDAFVDAHLANFDVSDDIGGVRLSPLHYVDGNRVTHIGVALQF